MAAREPEDPSFMHDTQPYRRPVQPHARRVRRASSQPRRPANWRRRVGIGLAIVLVAALVGLIFLLQRAVAFNDAVSTESALSMRIFGPFSPERVNILLLGYSDESRDGAYLSDSMNVLSIDKTTDATTMIPIPRDLWVEGVAEVPQNMKINEALRIGYYEDGLEYGAELASKAVTQVTGLPIHAWISLDFLGFQAMVDAIGGVTIDNPRAFNYTWGPGNFAAGRFQYGFKAGTLELDGARALDYARNRYTSLPEESSDFARLVRQQRVLQAIRAKVTGWQTLPRGMAVADALEGHLHTNLPVLDLGLLVGKLDVDRRVEIVEGEIVQASTNTDGQYILVVIGQQTTTDYSPMHRYVADALARAPTPSAAESPNPG